MQKYQPWNYREMSWGEILELYQLKSSDDYNYNQLMSLVEFIVENKFSERLFGFVSKLSYETLIISIYNPIDRHKETLHISFDAARNRWHFEYYPEHYKPVEMDRYYSEGQGINKFIEYIKWLKW